ncbi:5558_t:CDS:1, partial [Dentiscutata heterogama]
NNYNNNVSPNYELAEAIINKRLDSHYDNNDEQSRKASSDPGLLLK